MSLNPPVRWLLLFIGLVLGLSFLFAPEPQPVNLENPGFSTTSDSRLYFQNVRSFFYHRDARSKKPMIQYRLKRREPKTDSLSLQFAIILNPHSQEAFPYVELGKAYKQSKNISVDFIGYSAEPLQRLRNEDHQRVAAKVYNSLLSDESVYLLREDDTLKKLYTYKSLKISVETSLEDYFKLTNRK